jgi:hypothetical protein
VSGTGSPHRSQNVRAAPFHSARSRGTGRSQAQSEPVGVRGGGCDWAARPFWDGPTVTL